MRGLKISENSLIESIRLKLCSDLSFFPTIKTKPGGTSTLHLLMRGLKISENSLIESIRLKLCSDLSFFPTIKTKPGGASTILHPEQAINF
mmetsp:Transcript_21881/g.39907  ORF Transcript_21881/g.39907 Transcript_21881/m.39907 type:complete len:91 (-) Transcript_21881:138-410(-)